MIDLLLGIPGSGKTLKAIQLMEQSIMAGRRVATDIELTPACPWRDKVMLIGTELWPVAYDDEELDVMEQKHKRYLPQFYWQFLRGRWHVFLDELDLRFDSSNKGEAKKEMRVYIKNHEKYHHNITGIVQVVTNLHKRIRSQATRCIVAENTRNTLRIWPPIEKAVNLVGFNGKRFCDRLSRFIYEEYGHESSVGKVGAVRSRGYLSYAEASRYFKYYNTKQLLGDVDRIVRGNWEEKNRQGYEKHDESGDVGTGAGAGRRGQRGRSRAGVSPVPVASAVA